MEKNQNVGIKNAFTPYIYYQLLLYWIKKKITTLLYSIIYFSKKYIYIFYNIFIIPHFVHRPVHEASV